jgi:quinol monooxygenase YgiN
VGKLALIIRGRSKPGKRDDIRQLFELHLAKRAISNDAQEVVVWCADDKDPDAFHLFEVYRDRTSFQANATAPWFQEYMEKVRPLIAGQPELIMATPQWSKGIQAENDATGQL